MVPDDQIEFTPVPVVKKKSGRARTVATIAGSILIGGAVGAAVFVPALANAQSGSTAPTTSSATSTTNGGTARSGTHVGDLAVAATAIGISEADLRTALGGGQTIAAVAKAHGVDPATVIAALVADDQSELAAAVKAGRITQAQADSQTAQITQRATDQVNGTFRGPGLRGPGMGGPGFGGPGMGHQEAVSDLSVVAKAIGISEADLRTALGGGQTIAAVAKAHSVDTATIIAALVADGQSELDAAVKAGRITQAQADSQKTQLTQRATDQVNGTLRGPGMGGPGMGGPGFGGPGMGGWGHRPGDNDGSGTATPNSSAAPTSTGTNG